MQEILKEYGGALLTVIAVLALATLITVLINGTPGSDTPGIVQQSFNDLITQFFAKAKVN